MSHAHSSRQAEKDYLRRSGAAPWERVKPFPPRGESNLAESLHLIQDFGACVALLDPAPHLRVLDVGAGGCWASDWLQRLGLSVVAVDLSADLLAIGSERLAATGAARVVCGDAEALPFAPASFDRALCLNAMHHVPDVPAALAELARVLTPDGLAVFSEPGAGHAHRADAVRAVQDFGVQEADIEAAGFLDQCHAAGFSHVVLEPFSHLVPGHGLTAAHWRRWQALAASSRPRRALATLWRGVLELVGARKDTDLFGEAFASEALRVLRAAMADHPIVVASKRPLRRFLDRGDGTAPALAAAFLAVTGPSGAEAGSRIELVVDVQNRGTISWCPDEGTRGRVRLGAQLLDAGQHLIERDLARASLGGEIRPGASVRVTAPLQAPSTPGSYFVKLDMVSEGVTWFEAQGSPTAVHALVVTPQS